MILINYNVFYFIYQYWINEGKPVAER